VAPLNVIVLLATIGMRHRPRVIVSERNDPQRQKLREPLDWLRRKLYRYADIVTANTRGAIDHMQAFVPASKLFCIPNTVTPPVESGLSGVSRLPIVLNMARLHPQKGQDILLEAFAILPEAIKAAWSLRIIGEGPEFDNLRNRASTLGLPDSVLTGRAVANPWPEYAQAGIFVLPSRFEGLPNVLLEAMSMGCACVVSDASPGPLEFLEHEHSGLVFASGDARALSKSLQRLMQDPGHRDRLGRNAQAAVAGLSEDRVLGQWMSILQ
jgi:glycosyltransferase involved in cell wall biosynthesis